MDEQSRLTKDEGTVQNDIHKHIPGKQSENVLLVAHELAKAGDELSKRFSKVKVKQDTVWENVKRYALIVTFRLLFGIVWTQSSNSTGKKNTSMYIIIDAFHQRVLRNRRF